MFENLTQFELPLLQALNGSDSLFMDRFISMCTSGYTWIPLYLAIFYMIVKNNESMKQIALLLFCGACSVILADLVVDGIIKGIACRPRPCDDPVVGQLVQTVEGVHASGFSFFSAHAANTMSVALFISLIVRSARLTTVLMLWSLLNGYTRVYLGLHYPSDLLVGYLWGAVVALTLYMLYIRLRRMFFVDVNFVSTHYTSTGYSFQEIHQVICVIALTIVTCMTLSIII